MRLRTLGRLSVEGMTFRREKVLLLLAYLCIEGSQTRRRLAELFWPDAANPMNSLAQHLVHLRSLPGALIEDGPRVASGMVCDACTMRTAIREGRHADAVAEYDGAYLDGLTVPLGPDLEEWLYETREALAREVRGALIVLATQAAAHGHATQAADLAARALTLVGAPPADELELPRLWHLLSLTGHPLAAQVEREARDLGLALHTAPTPPATPFVGREEQLHILTHLAPGHVAWITGHAGMGKTALIEALARTGGWTVLHGQGGSLYRTLEPLTPDRLMSSGHASALRNPRLRIALDVWEAVDDASRQLIEDTARERRGAALVIASRLHPAFDVDVHLQLDVLTSDDLQAHPGLHERTEGHPTLVAAALRGQPLDVRQGARVRALPAPVRDTYLMLALQDPPDLRATRRATGMSADTFALSLSHLTQEGLTAEGGHVYAAAAARDLLEQVPVHAKLLHLKLARALSGPVAWPHYEAARDLWEDMDEDGAARAAGVCAARLQRRGFPGQAVALLDTFADRADLAVQYSWALIGVGRYAEALKRLDALSPLERQSVSTLVARATALVRMGRMNEAVQLAQQISGSGPDAARAMGVLAQAANMREDWNETRRYSQIAAELWQLENEDEEQLNALALVAKANVRLGAEPVAAFRQVLERSQGLPSARGLALVNYAQVLIDRGQADLCDSVMEEAIVELTTAGNWLGLAIALGNLGVRRHLQGRLLEAAEHYREALRYLKGTGDIRHMGLALSNLSEIEGDLSAFEDTLQMLTRAGQHELVAQIRRNAVSLGGSAASVIHS